MFNTFETIIKQITSFKIEIKIWFCFQNGTWYHLDVHSKPHFLQKPDDIVYVSVGDSIILTCQVLYSI